MRATPRTSTRTSSQTKAKRDASYALFETPIGECAIAWTDHGVVALAFPGAATPATLSRLFAKGEIDGTLAAPPAPIRRAIAAVTKLLESGEGDLLGIELDLSHVTEFERTVYEAARRVQPGTTVTYGELAKTVGKPGGARAIGGAMGRNPIPIIVPCHRVLAAGGKVGGFSAPGGTDTKLKVLALEGVKLKRVPRRTDEAKGDVGYDRDEAVKHLRRSDARLSKLIEAVGPCTLAVDETSSTFRALAQSIVYQQLNGRAAATIFGRVEALSGRLSPERLAALPDGDLRGAGLSNAKMLAIRDLSERALAKKIPSLSKLKAMDDQSIIDCLTEVRGIGQWTVEMLLMFRLGRPDVLPIGDYGVRNGFSITFGKKELVAPKDLMAHGERWRPFRSVASWYLWRAVDLAKEKRDL